MLGLFEKVYKPQNSVYAHANTSDENASCLKNDSDDSLLEKELPLQIARRSIWSRYWNLIVAHFVLLVVYSAILFQVAARRPQDARSFGLPFCKLSLLKKKRERERLISW
jgi:hypothetical protein